MRFTYDDRARVTSWTDTNGSRYDYAYDDRDRCIAEGGVAGHVALRLDYDGTDPGTGLRVTTATTGSGAVHRYLVNDAHQIVAETDPSVRSPVSSGTDTTGCSPAPTRSATPPVSRTTRRAG
nr:hypothetical protein [Streptomyces sp. C8S0]